MPKCSYRRKAGLIAEEGTEERSARLSKLTDCWPTLSIAADSWRRTMAVEWRSMDTRCRWRCGALRQGAIAHITADGAGARQHRLDEAELRHQWRNVHL